MTEPQSASVERADARSGEGPRFGALHGVRVLDLTQALAGPFCTQILADHGADVVKIEPPVSGDLARRTGPYHSDDTAHEQSGYFHSVNRNKRSLVLDLKSPAGRQALLRLVPRFDVLVENYRTGVMDRLGLSYEVLAEHNPRLIYATVRGFGDPRSGESPYVGWPSFDVVAQAMGGISSITGPAADQPLKIGPGLGDTIPALYLTIGILSALLHARKTGEGQFVDVAMIDAVLAVTERIVHQRYFGGYVPRPEGNYHPLMSPFGLYPAKDGHVAIAASTQPFFNALCDALDAGPLSDDPGFQSPADRTANRDRLDALVAATTSRFTKAELVERLGGRVPFGPVFDIGDIAGDAHFEVRGMLPRIDVPGIDAELRIAGVPIKLSKTPGGVYRCGPNQGADGADVLREAGFKEAEIAALLSQPEG